MHQHLTTVHKATEGISAFVLCAGVSNENINKMGPRLGGIPLVTPTQPTNPLLRWYVSISPAGGWQTTQQS